MSFIPAGHRFYGWQKPRALTRSTFLYIDPLSPLLGSELRFTEVEFKPRLFFFDLDIWETALKLKAQLPNSCRSQKAYVEALGIALACELMRMNEDSRLARVRRSRRSPALAAKEADAIYRRASCRRYLTLVFGSAGAAQPVPFFSCIQAIVRHAATPISDQSANRTGQELAGEAQAVGDGDWI